MLEEVGRLDEAEASYRQAIALKPDFTEARSNLLFLTASMRFDASRYLEETRGFAEMVAKRISSPFKNWSCSYCCPSRFTPQNDGIYDENFWNDLEKYLHRINLLYLTGGEQTLVEGNYNFLQGLIDKGYAKNISLVFNTNATNFQQRFLWVYPLKELNLSHLD